MSPMFTIVPIFIGIVFVIVVVSIVARAGKGVAEWHHNNQLPVLRRDARVVAKRADVHSRTRHRSYTIYYATFEIDDTGERLEFQVTGGEYGMLVEGDLGALTHQGTRYKGFDRA